GATTRHRLMVPPTRAPGSPDRSGRPVQPRAGRFTWNGHHSHTAPLRPPRAARRHSELTSTVPGSTHVRGPCILACAPPVHNLVLSTVSPDQWTGDARSATAYPARPACRAAHRVPVFRASTELPRRDPRARSRARLLSRVLARGRKLSTGLLGAVDNSGIGARATRSTLRRAARGHAAGSGILEAPVPATSRRRLCSTTATARTTCLAPRHQRAGVDVATRPRRPGTPTCSHSGARRPDAPHPGVGTCRRTPGVHAPAPGAGQSPPRRSQELPGPSSAPPTLASQHPREPRPAPPARDAHHS